MAQGFEGTTCAPARAHPHADAGTYDPLRAWATWATATRSTQPRDPAAYQAISWPKLARPLTPWPKHRARGDTTRDEPCTRLHNERRTVRTLRTSVAEVVLGLRRARRRAVDVERFAFQRNDAYPFAVPLKPRVDAPRVVL